MMKHDTNGADWKVPQNMLNAISIQKHINDPRNQTPKSHRIKKGLIVCLHLCSLWEILNVLSSLWLHMKSVQPEKKSAERDNLSCHLWFFFFFNLFVGNLAESLTQKHQLENLPVCMSDTRWHQLLRSQEVSFDSALNQTILGVTHLVCVCLYRSMFCKIMIKTQCHHIILDTMRSSFEAAEIQTQAGLPTL